MHSLVLTLVVSLALSLLLGFALGFFKKLFFVEVDEKVAQIRDALPGANCGACGFPGCDGFAEAVATGEAPVNGCKVGAAPVTEKIAAILGTGGTAESEVCVLLCQGSHDVCKDKASYNGIQTCTAVKISINGLKNCDWGCIGFGDCERACPFDAIHIKEDGLPHVDYDKCTGCGICVAECPQQILRTVPTTRTGALALCSCRNPKKAQIMKNCKRGCIKCMKCERNCPKGAIKVINGIPVTDYTLCDSCGLCVSGCPTKVLVLLENKLVFTGCPAHTATA
ncbi:RnfABCDGE type electron transport complex subunit B [Treponema phagedenis]|uniref:Ion-translocating oxidoreductase complex subunit B n=1 Tax=Treponema phagedenis TaxID=162 RepID=A0AAE6IX08_TREPH|nr:RnfABCDGE type electron transport complex subunit B [Treponema phagedenis]EFW37504.1 electron transport complex, RnfABCDGE type, B subunit [Treponema phagedenis F0421]NVP24746.1 RnfABCDGE type electron transport complex subunit B [Treponema phagedenis]QEJ95859.1 RnfABCDGE type electron transport complex subunit B [Treponema phagedenis]QEJ98862.1 RnfABCDGE type electron transport complex subunit B [Treponema phagedenis]QEK00445.1 RnfABCDGE type electron transport complex subunit B [Treponema